MSFYISIDPGKKKCGLLLANIQSGKVIEAGIASLNKCYDLVSLWNENYNISKIIIGDGTNSKYIKNQLKRKIFFDINYVNEKGSTLRARFRYWEIWPPSIFLSWIPRGLLVPTQHLDAVAALVLLEDYLNKKLNWRGPPNFKIWLEP